MLKKLNTKRGAFTLVEIMIVVAIIALLASIAVPNFLRARKRSQATQVLEDCRMVDGAIDQWAIENKKKGSDSVDVAALKDYVKKGSRLETEGMVDIFGTAYVTNNVDDGAKVDPQTEAEFTDVIPDAAAFWGQYKK